MQRKPDALVRWPCDHQDMRTPYTFLFVAALAAVALFLTSCMASPVRTANPTPDEVSMPLDKTAQSDVFKVTVNTMAIRYEDGLRKACLDVTLEALAPYELFILPSWFTGVDKDGFEYLPQLLDTKEPNFQGRHGMKTGDKMRGWLTFYVKDAPTAPILTGVRFAPQVGDAVTVSFKKSE